MALEQLQDEEEALRQQIRQLSDSQRKAYYRLEGKRIKDPDTIFNPNVVKVVSNLQGEALYFSRSPLPHIRSTPPEDWLAKHPFYKHIGIYAYRTDILAKITQLPPSSLEEAESLEQLRWLQNGYRIQLAETELESLGIDTPEDLQKALQFLKEGESR